MTEATVRRFAPPDRRSSPGPYPGNIPACPEQQTMPQTPLDVPIGVRPPRIACCVECGRITARRWTDPEDRPLPWCGGEFPDPTPKG